MGLKVIGWAEGYTCGCSRDERYKRELPGYCGRHGSERQGAPIPLFDKKDLKKLLSDEDDDDDKPRA